jgi:hypothetical protein
MEFSATQGITFIVTTVYTKLYTSILHNKHDTEVINNKTVKWFCKWFSANVTHIHMYTANITEYRY